MGNEASTRVRVNSTDKASLETQRATAPGGRSGLRLPQSGRRSRASSFDGRYDPPPPYTPRTASTAATHTADAPCFQSQHLSPEAVDAVRHGHGHRRSHSACHRRPAASAPSSPRLSAAQLVADGAALTTDVVVLQTSAPHASRTMSVVVSHSSPMRSPTRLGPRITVTSAARSNSTTMDDKEDPLQLLRKYDTIIIVDDSTSMSGSRWREARDALAGIVEVASAHDVDGVDIHFLNNPAKGENLKTAREVIRLFDSVVPVGYTPTGEKLEELLLHYLEKLEHDKERAQAHKPTRKIKPVNFIVLTDGAPTDDPEPVILAAARRLDSHNFPLNQVGIQFVQIGNDRHATASLRKLDDDLSATHGVRDMVDTTPYNGRALTADHLVKILLGGINRRVDKR